MTAQNEIKRGHADEDGGSDMSKKSRCARTAKTRTRKGLNWRNQENSKRERSIQQTAVE